MELSGIGGGSRFSGVYEMKLSNVGEGKRGGPREGDPHSNGTNERKTSVWPRHPDTRLVGLHVSRRRQVPEVRRRDGGQEIAESYTLVTRFDFQVCAFLEWQAGD